MKVTIRNIRAICTAPANINLIVIKVETSEPGLYGLGCATFAYRHELIELYTERYMKPLLVRRDVSRIGDIWQLMNVNSYWRNGPVTNNVISGIDMALWDIKGKMANMPVYDLLGGKCRDKIAIYRHASGSTPEEAVDNAQRMVSEQGLKYVRIQVNGYGGVGGSQTSHEEKQDGIYMDPSKYISDTVQLFDRARKVMGDEIELCHDVHERIAPVEAVRLAKRLEKYRLFFLEDALSPEQSDYFRNIRQLTTTPIAMGELFNNPKEWDYLIANRLIDYIRCHISQIGGVTPAYKLAHFCEAFGVRTIWHGPGDVSPVGHAANVHLDLATPNAACQEWGNVNDERLMDVFSGVPEPKDGYVTVSGAPGFGVDIDEEKAKKYPAVNTVTLWTQVRNPDGSLQTP